MLYTRSHAGHSLPTCSTIIRILCSLYTRRLDLALSGRPSAVGSVERRCTITRREPFTRLSWAGGDPLLGGSVVCNGEQNVRVAGVVERTPTHQVFTL